ncbi:hypothetical protein [Mesorhizobium sp. M0207]|uniref:hypothetical protein n=1 Tax=Mesorhizobium sp. M0207 TaxID=2956915 RepID=UPI00333517A8
MAPAVPERSTSLPLKPVTGSLKTTSNRIGDEPAGSLWPAAWLMVTVGSANAAVGTSTSTRMAA